MIEMPSGVALLAIGAGLFFLFVLIWGSVAGLTFWPRLLIRLIVAAALIIFPLAFFAANQIETVGGGAWNGEGPNITISRLIPSPRDWDFEAFAWS